MDTRKIDNKQTKMIAHRGLSGLEKENTLMAFLAAANRSYYGMECDIHLTKDNIFVICHDANTARVSNENKIIKETTFDDLKKISLYEIDNIETKEYLKIPTLKDYIYISKKYQKKCIIELKVDFSIDEIKKLLLEIEEFNYLENVIFISFIFSNLEKIRELNKVIRLQYLVGQFSEEIVNLCNSIDCDVDINYLYLTEANIIEFHNKGIKVNVWTVDDPILAEKLVEWKVDYITTNILE